MVRWTAITPIIIDSLNPTVKDLTKHRVPTPNGINKAVRLWAMEKRIQKAVVSHHGEICWVGQVGVSLGKDEETLPSLPSHTEIAWGNEEGPSYL